MQREDKQIGGAGQLNQPFRLWLVCGEKFMNTIKILVLVFILLAFEGCSAETGKSQIIKTNVQEKNQVRESSTVNKSLSNNIQEELQIRETDIDSIKNTKGLIVLSNRYGKNDFIRFYNEDGSLWYEFTFYYDDSDGKFEYENENFAPFSFHPDYFSLALRCVGEDESRFEVIVNEETGLKKFVRKADKTLKFETLENHILKTFAIDFNRTENPLRKIPEGEIKVVDLPKEITFHPVEVKGEWLKVRWDNTKKDTDFGWIKWKENDKILIELFYFA